MVLVTDTNVWIDLYHGGLIQQAFRTDHTWLIVDVLIDELVDPDGHALISQFSSTKAKIVSATGVEVTTALGYAAKYPNPSRNDLIALAVAKTRSGILVSGDAKLRAAAKQESVESHGSLWVLKMLVDDEFISKPEGIESLKTIMAHNERLPVALCNRLLADWGD